MKRFFLTTLWVLFWVAVGHVFKIARSYATCQGATVMAIILLIWSWVRG